MSLGTKLGAQMVMKLARSVAVNTAYMYEHNTAHAAAIIYPKIEYLLLVAQMDANAISHHARGWIPYS